jgi:hypothetical protein
MCSGVLITGEQKFSMDLGMHLKILDSRRVIWKKLPAEDPPTLGATLQNLVATATWLPDFLHPWLIILEPNTVSVVQWRHNTRVLRNSLNAFRRIGTGSSKTSRKVQVLHRAINDNIWCPHLVRCLGELSNWQRSPSYSQASRVYTPSRNVLLSCLSSLR